MISRKENSWVILFSIILILITSVPYLIAYQLQQDQWRYSGFVFGVEDGNSYVAKMLSGANGDILFKTPYTPMDQSGFLAFLPYLLIGKLTSPPAQHEQMVALFHLFRWAGIVFLCFVEYRFISLFIETIFYRKLAIILSMAGGGLGWLAFLWGGETPLELYSPETFGFLSVYGIPHLLFSRALLLWGLYGFLSWKRNYLNSLKIGFLWVLVGFFQPLTIAIGWMVLGGYQAFQLIRFFWKDKEKIPDWFDTCKQVVIIFLISSPWVLYNYLSFLFDPYLRGWYEQNIILSPGPGEYLLSFGVMLPLVLWSAKKLIINHKQHGDFLISWMVLFPFLVYFPYNVQRRLADGFWVIWVILLLYGISSQVKLPKIWSVLGSVPLFTGSLILLTGGLIAVTNPSRPLFLPQDEIRAFEFLNKTIERGDVVMASNENSNALPAWVPARVVAGHGPESIHFAEASRDVKDFFETTNENMQKEIIQKYRIKFILLENESKNTISPNWDDQPGMKRIFASGDYVIYQVTDYR